MRRRPYTRIGITRKLCGCGKRARFQWGCCSLPGYYLPVCTECDIRLNQAVLEAAGVANGTTLLNRYAHAVRSNDPDVSRTKAVIKARKPKVADKRLPRYRHGLDAGTMGRS